MSRVPPGNAPPRRRPSRRVRRNRALLILVLIIGAIWLLVSMSQCSSGKAAPTPKPSPSGSGMPVPTPSASFVGVPTGGGIPAVNGAAPCLVSDLTVAAVTDKDSYAADEQPKLSLSITNNGVASCQVNVGTSQQVFQISGAEGILWQSTDCQSGGDNYVVTLQPQQSMSSAAPISWERAKSAPETCTSTDRPKAAANGSSYYLTTFVGQAKSVQSKKFVLN